MQLPHNHRRHTSAFTILELLVVIGIIATLASLLFPVTGRVLDSLNKTKCANNLRQVGMIIKTAAMDNDNLYPAIENDPKDPIHDSDEGTKIWTLPELMTHYQAPLDILKCPADEKAKLHFPKDSAKSTSYYDAKGSSFEWFPFFEGENINAPRIVTPRGARNLPPSRVRLLMDYVENGEAPHDRSTGSSTMQVTFADGSVRPVVISKE
jgi:type II secretory pathway pseudopilin PulG